MTSVNCIICADEFNTNELKNLVLSNINSTKFKICQKCLNKSDPTCDYKQARDIINSYVKFTEVKNIFSEIQDFLYSRK